MSKLSKIRNLLTLEGKNSKGESNMIFLQFILIWLLTNSEE